MKFGHLQPLRTIVLIVPLSKIIEPRTEAFERLDRRTTSSLLLLGYVLLDALLTPTAQKPSIDDMVRSFWNLYEETQVELPLRDESPDRVIDMIDAVFKEAVPLAESLFEEFCATTEIDRKTTCLTGCLLPFTGYDIAMQITYQIRPPCYQY